LHAAVVSFHIIICIAMILAVLLQTGKGADMGAAIWRFQPDSLRKQRAGNIPREDDNVHSDNLYADLPVACLLIDA